MTIKILPAGVVSNGAQLYSVIEVAARMKVSPQTVRRWISAKRIVAHKMGLPGSLAEWRISEEEIQRYLARGRSPR